MQDRNGPRTWNYSFCSARVKPVRLWSDCAKYPKAHSSTRARCRLVMKHPRLREHNKSWSSLQSRPSPTATRNPVSHRHPCTTTVWETPSLQACLSQPSKADTVDTTSYGAIPSLPHSANPRNTRLCWLNPSNARIAFLPNENARSTPSLKSRLQVLQNNSARHSFCKKGQKRNGCYVILQK